MRGKRMVFTAQDKAMMGCSFNSFRRVNEGLRRLTLEEAIQDVSQYPLFSSKSDADTKMLDAVPEEYIVSGHEKGFLDSYGEYGVVLSEERGRSNRNKVHPSTPFVISDPLDGSTRLKRQLEEYLGRFRNVGEMFDYLKDKLGGLSHIEAPASSVTQIKDGEIKYSLLLNLFNEEVYAAFEEGIFAGGLSDCAGISDLISDKNRIGWRMDIPSSRGEGKKPFILCNRNGKKRERNFRECHLEELAEHYLPADYFAGPTRFTYLLDMNKGLFPELSAVGFNCEPVSEWISNVCVAQHSEGALRTYIMHSPDDEYKLIRGPVDKEGGIDIGCIEKLAYPSGYNSSLVILLSGDLEFVEQMENAADKGYCIRVV